MWCLIHYGIFVFMSVLKEMFAYIKEKQEKRTITLLKVQ